MARWWNDPAYVMDLTIADLLLHNRQAARITKLQKGGAA